jgi:hypothetical protein
MIPTVPNIDKGKINVQCDNVTYANIHAQGYGVHPSTREKVYTLAVSSDCHANRRAIIIVMLIGGFLICS